MGKDRTDKGRLIDDSFRREAVRILATSGRTIKAVAKDLGVGVSSLGTWKRKLDRAELMAGPHEDVEKELQRLRRENELLRAERDLLKNNRGLGPPVGLETSGCYNGSRKGAADRFLVASDPVKKHGPWVVANLRVVTSADDPG